MRAAFAGAIAFLAAAALHAADPVPDGAPGPVPIDYFYEPGCAECFRIDSELRPELQARFEGLYALREWDLGRKDSYLKLAQVLEAHGVDENAHVFMLVDGATLLVGMERIAAGLFPALEERILARYSGEASSAEPPARDVASEAPPDENLLSRRFSRFTLPGVMLAGLIDGINPCAISTLVFLVSVLAVSRTRGSRLALVGGAFCLASFLTYTAIGLGLLHAFHRLRVFHGLRRAVDAGLVGVLVVLAVLSFRDAFRFHRSGRPTDVTLQLPARVKGTIHRVLQVGLGRDAQVATAFGIGALVTALESVCTGQVYVPTLVYIVRAGTAPGRGMLYLLVYNLMFVLPLVAVLLFMHHGIKVARLVDWSARNVVVSKIALGLFFLGLGAVILLTT